MKVLLLLGALLLSSCVQKITGSLDVREDLTFKKGKKTKTIKAGTYQAALNFKNTKKLVIKINDNQAKVQRITLRIPEGTTLPTMNGNWMLTAAQTKQPYDIYGDVHTDITYSDTVRDREVCSYTENRLRCYWDYQLNRQVCKTVPVTVQGVRYVEFHNKYEYKVMTVSLQRPDLEDVVAMFDGTRNSVQRIYDYYGPCQRYY